MDTMTLDWLGSSQAKLPWSVDEAYRPKDSDQPHIREGIKDGRKVIVNADGQAITVAPFKHASAIVERVNLVT